MRKWTGLLVVGLVGLAAAVPALVLRAQAPSPDMHLAFDVVSIKQAALPDSLVSTLSRNGACGNRVAPVRGNRVAFPFVTPGPGAKTFGLMGGETVNL